MRFLERNYLSFIVRTTIVLTGVSVVVFEGFRHRNTVWNFMRTWDNGVIFALKIIIIPMLTLAVCIALVTWCIKGFKKPRLNWDEGGERVAIVFSSIFVGGVFIFYLAIKPWVAIWGAIAAILICIIVTISVNWIKDGFRKSDDKDTEEDI